MENQIIKNEKEILDFWRKNNIFEKSVSSRPEDKPYVFYDGPPFATGLPHYGHIVASLMKDIVPRYQTMKGFRVERKWGWDCHGLPIENIVEEELDLKSKKDIENFGIDKFNNACHKTVLKYANEWKVTIERMGRWVDMEEDYKTMDIEYMESVWWVFNELWKKDLIYQGHKAMHICPRCETPLSNFEVTQGYKDVKDISITAKFKLEDPSKLGLDNDTYFLAWTTTPWTLPGNLLLAVGNNIKYKIIKILKTEDKNLNNNEYYILSDNFFQSKLIPVPAGEPEGGGISIEEYFLPLFNKTKIKIIKELKGKDLLNLEYEPLFPYFKDAKNAFKVVAGDFVTTEDGTGIVHIAPAFGDDDYYLGKDNNTEWVQHVGMDGKFIPEVIDFAGMEVKPKEDPTATDLAILKWLNSNNKFFSKEKYEHSYPHCWRCDSPLLNYATSSWFIRVTELKDDLLKNNQKINWVPEHIKEGRFGKWLEGARDWAVSRSRFWGDPLPIWQSEDGDTICVGSVKELEYLSGEKVTDIHKHLMDKIIISKNGKEYKRIPDVLDCWFESGSMPYGQMHYPFENKEKFEAGFPAQFIAEGQDQTRGWFYTLHILATALTRGKNPSIPTKSTEPAFKNVVVNGIVLAEDGKKMSKRLKNYPDPSTVLEKYGADALRYYLGTSPVMYGENLSFSETAVREVYNKVTNTLTNILELYLMYGSRKEEYKNSSNVLDEWIIAKLKELHKDVSDNMSTYKLAHASRPLVDFITDLSQWYVRRSRDRIKRKDEEALATLRYVLIEFAKISAPFIPFISEKIFQDLKDNKMQESVHLENWPDYEVLEKVEKDLIKDMIIARDVVEQALSLRQKMSIKVRQPLYELEIANFKLQQELLDIIATEINVKKINLVKKLSHGGSWIDKIDSEIKVALNIELTDELKEEGAVREVIRAINALRKEVNLTPNDLTTLYIKSDENIEKIISKYSDEIITTTSCKELIVEKKDIKNNSEVKVDGVAVWFGLE